VSYIVIETCGIDSGVCVWCVCVCVGVLCVYVKCV